MNNGSNNANNVNILDLLLPVAIKLPSLINIQSTISEYQNNNNKNSYDYTGYQGYSYNYDNIGSNHSNNNSSSNNLFNLNNEVNLDNEIIYKSLSLPPKITRQFAFNESENDLPINDLTINEN